MIVLLISQFPVNLRSMTFSHYCGRITVGGESIDALSDTGQPYSGIHGIPKIPFRENKPE